MVNINLRTKPEFIFDKNPGGKVPTLELDGGKGTLYESLIVSDYMDEAYPVLTAHGGGDGSKIDRLHSNDPVQRAKDRILIGEFSSVSVISQISRSELNFCNATELRSPLWKAEPRCYSQKHRKLK